MHAAALLESLLLIGRSKCFGDVERLPGAGEHRAVLCLSDRHAESLVAFVTELGNDDRIAFAKALAAYEHTVGGVGSVTTLHRLLPLVDDPDRGTLAWIISNTRSYWYYSNGATSLAALDAANSARSERTASNLSRERAREVEARRRKAATATERLVNAVRRGDINAVRALLALGADPKAKTPDGLTLEDSAITAGQAEIAAALSRPSGRPTGH